MWDRTESDVGDIREEEIKEKYWSDMLAAGSRITRFDKSPQSVRRAVDFFITGEQST